jgi:hypothetical protein
LWPQFLYERWFIMNTCWSLGSNLELLIEHLNKIKKSYYFNFYCCLLYDNTAAWTCMQLHRLVALRTYRPIALTSQILRVSSRCFLTISVRVQQPHTAQKLTILIQNYYKFYKICFVYKSYIMHRLLICHPDASSPALWRHVQWVYSWKITIILQHAR